MLTNNAKGILKQSCILWTPIWCVTLYFKDRRGVTSLLYNNRAEITVLVCKQKRYLVVLAQKLSGTTVNIVLHALPAGKKKLRSCFLFCVFRFGSVFNFSAPRASRASRGFTCCVNVLHVLSPWASKSSGESHIIRKPPKKKRNYFMNNQQHETATQS